MLNLFDYPIMLTKEEVKTYLDVNVNSTDEIMTATHMIIYDFLIYPTFNADIKNRIIERYKLELEKPIKKALLVQFKYLHSNGGNIGDWNGLIGGSMSADSKEAQDILTKILSPQVINILKGAPIDILYAGG